MAAAPADSYGGRSMDDVGASMRERRQVRERAMDARSRFEVSAFGTVYDAYLSRIHAFVLRRVRDRRVAEAITALTFQRALGAIVRAEIGDESMGGWLYRAAATATADHVRRLGARSDALGTFGEEHRPIGRPMTGPARVVGDEAAASAFMAAIDRDVLRRALRALPTHERRLLVLRFFDGLKPDELCGALECSQDTLDVRLRRALRHLHRALARETLDAA
jgi:RNA polymerase sigma-70 factor, ECF subfamily